MTKSKMLDPNSRGYTNALLEDMNEKFQIILEATAPVPKMQAQIATIVDKVDGLEIKTGGMEHAIRERQNDTTDLISWTKNTDKRLDSWEDNIKLIPAIFDEVGSLRQDVEVLKSAMKLLDRPDERLEMIEHRLTAVEQHLRQRT